MAFHRHCSSKNTRGDRDAPSRVEQLDEQVDQLVYELYEVPQAERAELNFVLTEANLRPALGFRFQF